MSTTLTNGLKLPDKGSVDWYSDMQNNYTILDNSVGTIAEHTTALSGKAPAVHTHTKSDVTNLFNSANTWSANNTYSADCIIYNSNSSGSTARLQLRNSKAEVLSTGNTGSTQSITFRDKNDFSFGYIYGTVQSNGAAVKIGAYAKDLSNNNVNAELQILSFTNGNKALFPATTNEYDLGISSFQWKSIFAKNYYYNGVAWGLDQANQWSSEQTCKSNNPKWINRNNNITLGVAPASNQTSAFYNYDKNGNEIGRLVSRVQPDGKTITWLSATNLYKNGSIDSTGSAVWANLYCAIDANGYPHVSTDCALTPNTNNYYDLGTSTNQWKSVYAQSYYYNGVAWGLDKANVWSGDNSFTSSQLTLKNSNITRGTIPNANRNYVLSFTDSNNDNVGMIFQQVRAGSGSYKMTFSLNNGTTDHRINFFGFANGTSSLIPEVSGVTELGSSDNKWKTLNGINPGALSLPKIVAKATADIASAIVGTDGETQYLDGTDNYYTAALDGWISMCIGGFTQSNELWITVYDVRNETWGTSAESSTSARNTLFIIFPIRANQRMRFRMKCTSVTYARFYPCEGNV